jgi:hypothetical protein
LNHSSSESDGSETDSADSEPKPSKVPARNPKAAAKKPRRKQKSRPKITRKRKQEKRKMTAYERQQKKEENMMWNWTEQRKLKYYRDKQIAAGERARAELWDFDKTLPEPKDNEVDAFPSNLEKQFIKEHMAPLKKDQKDEWHIHAFDPSQRSIKTAKKEMAALVPKKYRDSEHVAEKLGELTTQIEELEDQRAELGSALTLAQDKEWDRLTNQIKDLDAEWQKYRYEYWQHEYEQKIMAMLH